MVSVTYGHGFFNDGDDVSAWDTEHLVGMGADDAEITVDSGDYAKIKAVLDSGVADDEYVYYDFTTPINVSSSTFNRYVVRYKTSESSAGAAARVVLHWADGHSETILGGTDGVFSTVWKVAQGAITYTSSYIDNIQLWAIENGNGAGTDYVYYDFILLCKGAFTLPNIAYGMDIDFPPKEAILPIPSRDTDITQHLGTENAVVRCSCDLDQGTWKVVAHGDTIDGERFIELVHGRSIEPWQWLDTGELQFKVSLHPTFRWVNNGTTTNRVLDLVMKEYSLADKSGESYIERYGINL